MVSRLAHNQEKVGSIPTPATINTARIRRLTPKECARLQALDDDWLDFGINEKGETYRLSDSAKYKLAGNGVTVDVVEAIIKQIIL